MFDVICAGQAVIDCIIRGKENKPYKPNIYRADTIRLHTGGDAVNESMVLARLGRKPALVCGLGNDPAGDMIIRAAGSFGVDTARVKRIASMDTPIANIQVSEDGSRSSINSSATLLPGFSVDPEDLAGAKIVSFASLFRAPFDTPEKIIPLIRVAKENGAVICADTKLPLSSYSGANAVSALYGKEEISSADDDNTYPGIINALKDVLPFIDYIFPNENEAAFYSGTKDSYDEMGSRLLSLGIKNVIIKTGSDGCHVYGSGSSHDKGFHLPAEKVDIITDTTGAGDNFAAGFISALLDKASLRECAEAGIHAAALSLTHTGAVSM